jgi:CheY-like chemotaxis protein
MKRSTILCIDDESTGLRLRKMLLESEGYSVLLAPSGHEGLVMLQSSGVEAVVLDYRMPEMCGDEVALEIRKRWPSIPIVLLSGYPQDVPEKMLNQVNAFVWKGGDPSDLLTAICSVLHQPAPIHLVPSGDAAEDASYRFTSQSTKEPGRKRSAPKASAAGLRKQA